MVDCNITFSQSLSFCQSESSFILVGRKREFLLMKVGSKMFDLDEEASQQSEVPPYMSIKDILLT